MTKRCFPAGRVIAPPKEVPQPKNVVNLMDALKRSIAGEGETTPKKPPAPSQKPAKKPAARSGKPPSGSRKRSA